VAAGPEPEDAVLTEPIVAARDVTVMVSVATSVSPPVSRAVHIPLFPGLVPSKEQAMSTVFEAPSCVSTIRAEAVVGPTMYVTMRK